MKMKLDHIGIVVKDMEKAKEHYMKTYCREPLTDIIFEPAHKVNVMFYEVGYGSMPMIELISPTDEKSQVSKFLEKTGGGLHHLAYEVPDIEEAIEHFKSQNSLILGAIVPGAGHNNTRTVWLYTSEKNLVELIEQQSR